MSNNIIQFLFTAKDEASGKVKDLSNTMRGEGVGGLGDMDKATQAATRSTSKFAQVIKTLMTGNVAEAGRNLSEMGGKFAALAAGGAVAVVAIMAWAKVVKAVMNYYFEKHLYGIQGALNRLNGSVEASAKLFARQEASLKRVTDSAAAYSKTLSELREIQNSIANTQVKTAQTRMSIGEADPVRLAKINAAAEAELARQRIENERKIQAEKERAHAENRRAIERENKMLEEQSKKRLQLAQEAADMAFNISDDISTNIEIFGSGNKSKNEQLVAEQEKALSTQKQLLAENEADYKKRLDNNAKLESLKNDEEVFAQKRKHLDEMDSHERALADKRTADIAEMERKAAEETAKAKAKAEAEIELATVDAQIAQVEDDMAETERGFGLAARERVLEEAKALEAEGNRKFGKEDWKQRLDDNAAAKNRAKDERSFENSLAFARQMQDRIGGSFEKLPKNMQELIKMDDERKNAAAKAKEKFEQAEQMRLDEVTRQAADVLKLEELQGQRDQIQLEIRDLLEKNIQFQGD